jgi:type IV secretory pathway VirB10-like protein
MSQADPSMEAEAVARPESPEQAFRLRGDPPRVMRLSKKALILMGTVAAVAIGGALVFALSPRSAKDKGPELYDTTSRNLAEQLAGLPKDYAQVPKLGPPLPGDLGRPIVAAQGEGKDVPAPAIGPAIGGAAASPDGGPAAAQQAIDQAQQVREAARTSKLFTDQGLAASVPTADATPTTAAPPGASGSSPVSPGGSGPASAVETMPSSKKGFLAGPVDTRASSDQRLTDLVSPDVVQTGSIISAALITGLRSDLPGQITAQVTENVYDTPTGRILLIPQGARLVGEYDSQVTFGQERVLLAWTRLILPNGNAVALERQPGADSAGYAGLQDRVDNHWGKLFQAAMLSTILSVGAEAGVSNSEDNLAQAIREGASQSFSQAGQQIVERELNIQPTLTIRPGMPVRVMVTHDLVLEPYGGAPGRG